MRILLGRPGFVSMCSVSSVGVIQSTAAYLARVVVIIYCLKKIMFEFLSITTALFLLFNSSISYSFFNLDPRGKKDPLPPLLAL